MKITKNLGLNITDMKKDGLSFFNFDTDLGHNFEAIDANVVTHRNATNCILDIPKNIKLELTNGLLTLKKGSRVYIPNGFEPDGITKKFDLLIVENDISKLGDTQRTAMTIVTNENKLLSLPALYLHSGPTAPTIFYGSVGYAVWYDTTNNILKWTNNKGASWFTGSFPIGIQTETSDGYISIDQVFDGFGFIDSTFYALPGVKCLMPNGRNLDGSLKNTVHTLTDVQSYTITDSFVEEKAPVVLLPTHIGFFRKNTTLYFGEKPSNPAHHTRWYDSVNNYWYEYSNENGWQLGNYCIIGAMDVNNTIINSFTFKNTLQVVDFYDYQNKISELEEKIQALQTALEALQG